MNTRQRMLRTAFTVALPWALLATSAHAGLLGGGGFSGALGGTLGGAMSPGNVAAGGALDAAAQMQLNRPPVIHETRRLVNGARHELGRVTQEARGAADAGAAVATKGAARAASGAQATAGSASAAMQAAAGASIAKAGQGAGQTNSQAQALSAPLKVDGAGAQQASATSRGLDVQGGMAASAHSRHASAEVGASQQASAQR